MCSGDAPEKCSAASEGSDSVCRHTSSSLLLLSAVSDSQKVTEYIYSSTYYLSVLVIFSHFRHDGQLAVTLLQHVWCHGWCNADVTANRKFCCINTTVSSHTFLFCVFFCGVCNCCSTVERLSLSCGVSVAADWLIGGSILQHVIGRLMTEGCTCCHVRRKLLSAAFNQQLWAFLCSLCLELCGKKSETNRVEVKSVTCRSAGFTPEKTF